MIVCETTAEMRAACKELRKKAGEESKIGFVPTMGALHAGHISLMAAARVECDVVAASIFVNPLQFGANEDLEKYPREFAADCAKLEASGVDVLFAPTAAEMYPEGATTYVEVAGLSERLDGASRPGHFRGVATVVAKLFHIVGADRAYFGQKDAAQVAVLRRMVRDLNFPLEMVVCPIVREPDGLAMSSRNKYLSAEERVQAPVLRRALDAAESLFARGERRASALTAAMLAVFTIEAGLRVDFVAVVDADTLEPIVEAATGTLVAVAAWVGATRLIDNVVLV